MRQRNAMHMLPRSACDSPLVAYSSNASRPLHIGQDVSVFTVKRDVKGNIDDPKVRLVATGLSQREGTDCM
jgi:hypothetical protein